MKQPGPPSGFREEPFRYHQELELHIDSLSNLGQGVARYGDDQWVIFVPFSLPGERVRARIYRNHKTYSEADLLDVLVASEDRIDARCPLFGTCGGCQYQHLTYNRQLEWKRDQVAELLRRTAQIDCLPVEPPVASPLAYGYRSKITPHYQKPKSGQIGNIGFLATASRSRIVDVPQCPIASSAINAALPRVREDARAQSAKKKKGSTLLLRDSAGTVLTNPTAVAEEKVGEIQFSFLAGDFFQNNPSILPALTTYVAQQASRGGLRFLVDAYCGSGLFAVCCAPHFDRVFGVEINDSAADWARLNARCNQIENATFLAANAEDIFGKLQIPATETTVLIDPPRKGCSQQFIEQLIAFGPSRIVYVSCNPTTQARDLVPLAGAGFYPVRCQPFDLFPQTRHLECIITLEKAHQPTSTPGS